MSRTVNLFKYLAEVMQGGPPWHHQPRTVRAVEWRGIELLAVGIRRGEMTIMVRNCDREDAAREMRETNDRLAVGCLTEEFIKDYMGFGHGIEPICRFDTTLYICPKYQPRGAI